MIERIPAGVMTAEVAGDVRITDRNAAAKGLPDSVQDARPVPVAALRGRRIDVFRPHPTASAPG